jgi:hypothetical protein
VISLLELALNHIDSTELLERAADLDQIVRDGHGYLLTDDDTGSVSLIATPTPPTLPALPCGLA